MTAEPTSPLLRSVRTVRTHSPKCPPPDPPRGHDGQPRPSGALFSERGAQSCLFFSVSAQLRHRTARCFLRWIQLIVRRVRSAHRSLSRSLSLSPLSLLPFPSQNKECISSSSSVMALSHGSSPLPSRCGTHSVHRRDLSICIIINHKIEESGFTFAENNVYEPVMIQDLINSFRWNIAYIMLAAQLRLLSPSSGLEHLDTTKV